MTRSQIINLILARCGRQENDTYLAAQALTEFALIQERLEGGAFMPWFLLTDEVPLITVANDRTVTLPAPFLREYEDFPLYRYDATAASPYTRMQKDEFDVLESQYSSSSADIPAAYSLDGGVLNLFPTPNDAYTLRWQYYAKQPTTDAGGGTDLTNAWTINASDLLVAELGSIIAGHYKRDQALAAAFQQDIVRAYNRLVAFDEARKQAAKDAHMGDAQ